MRKITDVISKPSEALRAMVDGLLEQSKREDFVIDMSEWGRYDSEKEVCFGCAATCALQKLSGHNLREGFIEDVRTRAAIYEFDRSSVDVFENAVNYARCGDLYYLISFFKKDVPPGNKFEEWNDKWHLSEYWEEEIPKIEAVIKDMQEAGY